jgi:nucleotide-binding universal stress UspA family protein
VLVGYDGSLAAGTAIDVGSRLMPGTDVWVAHVWTPPFASEQLRRRLWRGTAHVNEFVEAVEHEGHLEADRIAAMGVALAQAAGWTAKPVVARAYSGEGLELTEIARKRDADLILVGSRGLGGARAVLGSVSDMTVHYATQPVVVVPYPLLAADYDALPGGPVLVGWDGSPGAQAALDTANRFWPHRDVVPVSVDLDVDQPSADARTAVLQVSSRHEGSAAAIADALTATAHERDAAALVVGSRGRSAVREIVLGSVAMSTLHRAHRLVMVVPHTAGAVAPREVKV